MPPVTLRHIAVASLFLAFSNAQYNNNSEPQASPSAEPQASPSPYDDDPAPVPFDSSSMLTCRDVKQMYQEASCCGGNPDGLVDFQVTSECEWVESAIETTLPEHVLSRPGTSHTLEDGRTIYLQSLIDQDNADAHGLVVAWDWTQPNSLLWVANVTDRVLLDIEGFAAAYAGFYYYWTHSNPQTPYVWNNTVYTMSNTFPFGFGATGPFPSPQWVASIDLLTGRVLHVAQSWPSDFFLATRGAAHVAESVTGEATLVLPAVTLNYQLVNSYDPSQHSSFAEALTQDGSDKRYMHSYSDSPPNPKVNIATTGCGHLIGLDPVTLERKWVHKTCADAYKVGDVLGEDAFAPDQQYHIVETRIAPGFVFESHGDINGVLATTVFTQDMWDTRRKIWVTMAIPEGYIWPADGVIVATSRGNIDAGDLRKWIQKRLYKGYTFPSTPDGAIEAAWMSEAGGNYWRSNSINIPYKGEKVAVFTSGNGVNIPHSTMELYRGHCDTMPNSLGHFWMEGVTWEQAKTYFVDQVKCRLDVWKTKSSVRERRNYNNAQVGMFANGTVAFVAKDEAYDPWTGCGDPGKEVAGNVDGSRNRISDAIDCDPIPGHYIEDNGTPYLVWGSKCGIRHKFNLNTLTSEIITMEGWPGRTGGNHFSDVMVQKPGKDPIIVSIYENHQSGNQYELGSNAWNTWTNMSSTHEGPFTVWTANGEVGFNDLPNWEGFQDKYAVGIDPITLERKWITGFLHYGDTTFLQAKSDVLGVVPIRMADDITRVFDAYSGKIVYENNFGVGSYAGWVNVNSHLFVSTFGRYDPYAVPAPIMNKSSSLYLLHYKCDGDNALGAMHQTFQKTIDPIVSNPTMLDYAVQDVMDRRPTDDERAEFAWISALPRVMARAAVVDYLGYATRQLNFDRDIDLSGKTYLIVGGSSGQGFQTGLVLAQMGAAVHLIGRTQRIYDLSIASARSSVHTPAEYPFYSGMRDIREETISRMNFVTGDVRSLESYRAAVQSTGTSGTFDGILISAGSFKVENATEKEFAYQMGFSTSYAEEMDAFPTRFEGATTASQFPTQVASTRHTAILLNENVLTTSSVSIIASIASMFDITIGFQATTTFGYMPYTFAKTELARDAPVYIGEQGVNNLRLHEPGGVFTSVNLAYQMGKLLDLGNEENVPPGCNGHSFTSQTAQYALGKWDGTVALFGAFTASLNDEQRTHMHSISEDGCIAYFNNFGVASLLTGNGMTTELELAFQIVRGMVYPAFNTTVHVRDGTAGDVPERIKEVYTGTRDPVARTMAAAYMQEFRFTGSSDAKQELFTN